MRLSCELLSGHNLEFEATYNCCGSTILPPTLTLSEMLGLDEMTELETEVGEPRQHMEQYLETFDTSLQSDTPYSDVTQVSKIIKKNMSEK